MKYFVFALFVYLCPVAVGLVEDALGEAQVMSDEPQVNYVMKRPKHSEIDKMTLTSEHKKHRLMHPKFFIQKKNSAVQDQSSAVKVQHDNGEDVPKHFDARIKWRYCRSLFNVPDQANCRSCWAVAAAAAMSDRLCIATNGTKQVELSAEELVSCVSESNGCQYGWPIHAWKYLVEQGVVTGGSYGSKDSCLPYSIKPCGFNNKFDIECQGIAQTPSCVRQCQPGYNISFQEDKHYGKSYYNISNSTIAIQRDIMTYGPVTAIFDVYRDFFDFLSNKTGRIYKHHNGTHIGEHVVKIIGWGEENNVPYWIIANSWGVSSGENGFFRMVRGINECGIEGEVSAGHLKS